MTVPAFDLLTSLASEDVFALLTPWLRELPSGLRVPAARNLRLILLPGEAGWSFTLVLPRVADGSGSGGQLQSRFEQLRNQYSALLRRHPGVAGEQGIGPALPLLDGLTGMLLAGCAGKEASPLEGEFLVVSEPGITPARAAAMFGQLAVQSTATKWQVCQHGEETRYLFAGTSQRDRNGNTESLEPLLWDNWRKLRAFGGDGFTVYLPERLKVLLGDETEREVLPDEMVLKGLQELLTACPELLADGKGPPTEKILLAVVPAARREGEPENATAAGGGQGNGVLRANTLVVPDHEQRWRRNFFLEPEYQRIEVQLHHLQHSQEAHDALRAHLQRQRGCEGYTLELRDTGLSRQDQDLEKARQDRAYHEYRCHLLEQAQAPRPSLLRFSHDQLPELARLLRETPFDALSSQGVCYGYFLPAAASPTSPEEASPISQLAYHYLYFERGWGLLADSSPLVRYARDCELGSTRTAGRPETMRFWLDPFWAKFYPEDNNNYPDDKKKPCLIFVPEGKALFPTLHGWDAREMDRYLRDVLRDLVQCVTSEQPVYVFDGPYGTESDRICITVMDRTDFVPFRQRLGWINDHLDVLAALDTDPSSRQRREAQLAGMAAAARWDAIQVEMARRGESARERVQAAAERSRRELADEFDAAVSLLERQLEEAYVRLQPVYQQVQQFDKETAELQEFLRQAKGIRDKVLAEGMQLERDATSAGSELKLWVQHANKTLKDIEDARARTEQEVRTTIDKLKQTRDGLRDRLLGP